MQILRELFNCMNTKKMLKYMDEDEKSNINIFLFNNNLHKIDEMN